VITVAAAVAVTAASAAEAAAISLLLRAGFVDGQRAAFNLFAIEL
jgi:hypothetical protein